MPPRKRKTKCKVDSFFGQGAACLPARLTLLIRRDSLLVLNLGLDIVDGVTGLDIQGDGLAGQGLDKDLHASSQAQDQVQSRLFLDVVVGQGAAVL